MRTFCGKFYFDRIPLIASYMEFLLEKAYYVFEEIPPKLCTNRLSLLSVLSTYLSIAEMLSFWEIACTNNVKLGKINMDFRPKAMVVGNKNEKS